MTKRQTELPVSAAVVVPTPRGPHARPWFVDPARRLRIAAVTGLLVISAALAITSLLGDSITYDETSHLTAGMSVLKTGDYRLAPDHPPLAKLWATWPLLLVHNVWPPADHPGWIEADMFKLGRTWLFELNDGDRLLRIARCMIVVLLLALLAAIYFAGRRLFGPRSGLLALVLAALSPTLLAHGRLVTTDLPIAVCIFLTLLAFARLMQRFTGWRLLAVAAALGAASVTKMSWPLVLPALLIMAAVAIWRSEPTGQPARPRLRRILHAAGIFGILAVTTSAAIWTCYGWRTSMFAGGIAEKVAAGTADPVSRSLVEKFEEAWPRMLHDESGKPRAGMLPAFLQFARAHHLLPDAYLFGLAWTLENTSLRSSYFCGEVSNTGTAMYFPVAFAIKTPIPTLVLVLTGISALVRQWRLARARQAAEKTRAETEPSQRDQPARGGTSDPAPGAAAGGGCGDPVLLAGMLSFVLIYSVYVISSNYNIGQRHLLPIYPILYVVAGASAHWLSTRPGRWLVPAALAWLIAANAFIYPNYLAYFNEFIGGPDNGYKYLADSNLDWGQDLKRLATYARRHPNDTFKLAYFGSDIPARYGFHCQLLPCSFDTGSAKVLDGGGRYVISATFLVGLYVDYAPSLYWEHNVEPEVDAQAAAFRDTYRTLHDGKPALADLTPEQQRELQRAATRYPEMRWGRFLYNLRQRPPVERIGRSLFVYRLTQKDIDDLTMP